MKFHSDQLAELYIIPRDSSSKKLIKIPLDCQFNFHFVNAFEEMPPPTAPTNAHTNIKEKECSHNIILGR